VFVVDDEPIIRMLITDVLGDLGYRAIEAIDGAAGLQLLRSDIRIDLIDSRRSPARRSDGRQMADAGRKSRPGLKTLFFTSYAESAVFKTGRSIARILFNADDLLSTDRRRVTKIPRSRFRNLDLPAGAEFVLIGDSAFRAPRCRPSLRFHHRRSKCRNRRRTKLNPTNIPQSGLPIG
jgi:CheY-like chemotaxis protein